ncbi:alpha/beta hydrolase [Actinotalea ferrariae]|uniref:alpha/beta hydrolase n=1 Tax=Actinotalea ferrariae TaxID=1386098 RepID=UPI001C8B0D99|nr:alpha/beta hydrolase [Actinotalea ferrariae]MBX9246793.1 alpha/beta hydrolase [Actinotalea ferrariae]
MTARWEPDVLGDGFERTTLELGPAPDGPVVATLVRHRPEGSDVGGPTRPALLYVHGFNDYFFQRHLAERATAEGYAFHAIDLRRCGRSLREGQVPHFVTELTEHAADLTAAARLLRRETGHERLVVMAHSTGGLTASLWAHSLRRAGVVDALVLNSPWFDLRARWFHRVVSTRVLDLVGPLDPLRVVAEGPSAYSHHLHVDHGGRWEYDLALKPAGGFPVRASWLRAVRRGQARLAQGLRISAPVLVATSAGSGPNRLDNPDLDRQDTVLDVAQIAARAPLLGPDVTLMTVDGGIHDLALSAPQPRAEYLDGSFAWLASA